jgi:hypothetical protein
MISKPGDVAVVVVDELDDQRPRLLHRWPRHAPDAEVAIYLWRLLEASGRRVLSFCGEAKGGDLPDSTPIWHHASCPPTRKALVGARSPASSTRKASRLPAAGRSGTRVPLCRFLGRLGGHEGECAQC